ncbi:MAG: EpsI family protein [Gemmatimonadetes bacterium]|nr:EpsI family protein [Gemmatimonadota bacterium]
MRRLDWGPAALLLSGIILVEGLSEQQRMPLRAPLADVLPASFAGMNSEDLPLSREEERVAGMSSYVFRLYSEDGDQPGMSLYVGYYESQAQGQTIHSPRNCLPGAGWEALRSTPATVVTPDGVVTVNRYLVQRGGDRALVLYWYQGRGRVEASEYSVKLDLLRDAALRRRSEEALVRVMVPITAGEAASFELASRLAAAVMPAVSRALPEA